jgi:hypothetical protein
MQLSRGPDTPREQGDELKMSNDHKDADLYPFTPPPPPPGFSARKPRRSRLTKTAAGLAVILGAGAGAAAVASATTSSPATPAAASSSTTTTTPSTAPGRVHRGFFGGPVGQGGPAAFGAFAGKAANGPVGGFRGPGGLGGMSTLGGLFGPDGVIHGTYTLKGPNGDYETIDTQYGKAGSVSEGSITVTSADGYVQVYTVDSSTVVDADSSGITSVNNGDTVTVTATVSGDTATAQTVIDLTQVQANRKSWAPGGPKGPGPWGGTTTTTGPTTTTDPAA